MSAKPADFEASGCTGKKTYSFVRAKGLAREVSRRHDEPMQHYHCTWCKGWHIGRPKRQGKRNQRIKEIRT